MDTTSCLQTRCPPQTYLSNDIDVGKCMKHYAWHLFNSLLILHSTTHLPSQKIHKNSVDMNEGIHFKYTVNKVLGMVRTIFSLESL